MDRDQLAAHLEQAKAIARQCRPQDAGDRTMPAAREWLRRWAPKQLLLPAPACSCAAGRCPVCN